jgi:DNA polymerase III subunit delta'
MFFKDIPGQQEIKERLIRNVIQQRVSHAQLFTGGEGTMKLPMAVAYARFLCCTNRFISLENPGASDACGICPSCLKFNNLAHPDLHFAFPTISQGSGTRDTSDNYLFQWRELWKSSGGFFGFAQWLEALEAGNKQPILPVEECNRIIRKLSYKSYESEYKVMIIWLAEKFFHAAAPRILKILEEPPDKTLFILTTEEPAQIISTIISRTQVIRFPKVQRPDIAAWLENRGIESLEAERAAFLSDGNIIKAIGLTKEKTGEHFERFRQWLRLSFKPRQSMNELISHCEELAGMGREAQKEFLAFGLDMLQQAFFAGRTGKMPGYRGEESDFITNIVPFVHPGNIRSYEDLFNNGVLHIERNANPRLVFLDMALKLVKLIRQPA